MMSKSPKVTALLGSFIQYDGAGHENQFLKSVLYIFAPLSALADRHFTARDRVDVMCILKISDTEALLCVEEEVMGRFSKAFAAHPELFIAARERLMNVGLERERAASGTEKVTA